jgi:hypothetical protein
MPNGIAVLPSAIFLPARRFTHWRSYGPGRQSANGKLLEAPGEEPSRHHEGREDLCILQHVCHNERLTACQNNILPSYNKLKSLVDAQ